MSYSIFLFPNLFIYLFILMFKLSGHSKGMIIYQMKFFWNFDRFPDCQILEIF